MRSAKHILEIVKKDQLFYRFKSEIGSIDLNNNNKIVVSISGGIDSVGLLFLLKALDRYRTNISSCKSWSQSKQYNR